MGAAEPALSTILVIYYVTTVDASSRIVPQWQGNDAQRQIGTASCQNGKALSPDEWLTLIERHALALREVGVLEVELDGCRIVLSPSTSKPKVEFPGMDDAAPRGDQAAQPMGTLNALDDPDTFGGRLPGYQVPTTLPAPIEE